MEQKEGVRGRRAYGTKGMVASTIHNKQPSPQCGNCAQGYLGVDNR